MKRNRRPPPLVNLQLFCWKGDLHPFGVDHKRNSNDCIGTIILISALTTNSRTTKSSRAVARSLFALSRVINIIRMLSRYKMTQIPSFLKTASIGFVRLGKT